MHLADLHLGAPLSYLGDKAARRSGEIESTLVRAIESAPEHNVHAILIAGDLFDSFNPPTELVSRVKEAFKKAAGVPIILIPGTHDSYRYSRCVYRHTEFPGADVLADPGRPLLKKLNGYDIHFYGFSGGRQTVGDAPAFSRGSESGMHVALVHGPVAEADHWDSAPRDYPLTPKDIEASGFDYIALGHYHNFRRYRFGKTTAVYPGTLEGLKHGEEGDRYLVVAEMDEDRITVEKTPHDHRALVEIKIDLATAAVGSIEGLFSALEKRSDPDAIARVSLTGPTDFLPPMREIEARCSELFFHAEISDRTSVIGGELIRSIMSEDTVRGIFVRKMLDRIENSSTEKRETAELALRLGIEQFIRARDENN